MKLEELKGIPYGISDYSVIRQGNFYYVDKTLYLRDIEKAGRYLFFIRPRRFGKSLFLSMMKCYYDITYKGQFEEFFKGTWIFDNPTQERGKYLTLFLNFSEVSPAVNQIEASFLALIRDKARAFVRRYHSQLSKAEGLDDYYHSIKESRSPSDILGHLNRLVSEAGQKMFVIIDEYDNFANNLLTASGEAAYHNLTHSDGFLRTFFNTLKAGTGDVGSPIARLFITGVSPVTMDDVTSGFNIGDHVSLHADLNRMIGFTRQDVETMVTYYRDAGQITHNVGDLLELMEQWYGNYLFSDYAPMNETLFNSDMVLYFLKEYMRRQGIPSQMIDRNVRIDYGKLKHLIIIDADQTKPPTTNGNFSKLKEIIEKGEIQAKISEGFSLKEMAETDNFKSLLFYFGLLTIGGRDFDLQRLKIPNETVKRLYFNYITAAYKETGVFSLDLSRYAILMNKMAVTGDWRPLMEFLISIMKESMALRDLMAGEKSVQSFLYAYLSLSDLFIVHAEKELNKGYADLVLEAFTAKYPELNHSFLLELKYVKAGMKTDDPKLPQLVAAAEKQIKNYAQDEKFKKNIGSTKLVKLLLIFSGPEAIAIEEVKH